MEGQCNPESWRAHVEIKENECGNTEIYIDGKKVNGVIRYSVEQNSTDKRYPILKLEVVCDFDMSCGAIPLLPEPWTWFYKPKYEDFKDVRNIGRSE